MNYTRLTWKLSALLLVLGTGLNLSAQELSLLGGVLPETRSERSSYTYQVDYRQDLYRNFAGSIAYLNEGHLRHHHRDGTAWEAWANLPLFDDHMSVSFGVGGYYFFDTQPLPNGDSLDVHGTAPIYSLSATGYLSNRVFYRVLFNRITPNHQINVNTMTVGAGIWLGQEKRPTPGKLGDAPEEYSYVTENELTLFGGQSVVNTFFSQRARAYGGEYRRGLMPHLDWTVSGIYEGDPEIIRRSGVATQLWFVNTFFNERLTVGGGLGPYFFLDHKNPVRAGTKIPAAIAPLASLTISTRLSEHWIARMVFDRVTTSYNRDADIFLIGLGYRWGHQM
jgi:hypothetical protein